PLGLELAVFAALLLLFVLAVVARRQRALAASAQVAEDLSALVERSIAELEAEQDPRRAVIAAYAGMEQALAANGLPRDPAEAPLEYLARALVALRVEERSARRLTELFQRARFSPHQIGAASKQDAIGALVAVRDQLRAAAAEPGAVEPGAAEAGGVAGMAGGRRGPRSADGRRERCSRRAGRARRAGGAGRSGPGRGGAAPFGGCSAGRRCWWWPPAAWRGCARSPPTGPCSAGCSCCSW